MLDCLAGAYRLRSIGKSGFRVLQSNAKSENGFQLREIRPYGGFQLRNPNPDFMDFLLLFDWEIRKRICKTIIVNCGLLFANYAWACKAAVLKNCLSNRFSDFPKKTERKGIQEQISQCWNPFSDFAFDCKSKIRILKSKSRFPNWTHPQRKETIRKNFQALSIHLAFNFVSKNTTDLQ